MIFEIFNKMKKIFIKRVHSFLENIYSCKKFSSFLQKFASIVDDFAITYRSKILLSQPHFYLLLFSLSLSSFCVSLVSLLRSYLPFFFFFPILFFPPSIDLWDFKPCSYAKGEGCGMSEKSLRWRGTKVLLVLEQRQRPKSRRLVFFVERWISSTNIQLFTLQRERETERPGFPFLACSPRHGRSRTCIPITRRHETMIYGLEEGSSGWIGPVDARWWMFQTDGR